MMSEQTFEALSALLGRVVHQAPELAHILKRAKAGEIDETQAMTEMLQAIRDNPELEQRLVEMAHTSLVPPSGDTGQISLKDDPRAEWLVQLKPGGLPQLNPLFEAYLIERSQFDGDMPELRTGPMPDGVAPSVSVDTKARNPVAIGVMMEEASKKVRGEIDAHEAERRQLINRVSEDDHTGKPRAALEAINASEDDLSLVKKHSATIAKAAQGLPVTALLHGSPDTDYPGYRRREIPKPVKVDRVSGGALVSMTEEQRRESAWKFLSTVQGRRTAVITVRELVASELTQKGLKVTERDYDKGKEAPTILAHHEWTIQLSGAGSTQASFSLIDMASKALAIHLMRDLPQGHPSEMILEVDTVDQLPDRKVGWAARLLPPLV